MMDPTGLRGPGAAREWAAFLQHQGSTFVGPQGPRTPAVPPAWVQDQLNFGASRVESTSSSLPISDPTGGSGTQRDAFLAQARRFLGQAYLWGGGHVNRTFSGPGRVDCSGLVLQAARMAGFNLDGTAAMQQDMVQRISLGDLRPGDLVFKNDPATHVGIYIGNGQFMHAPRTGDVVKIQSMSSYTWSHGGRLFKEDGSVAPKRPGAAPAAPANADGILRQGEKGEAIKELQQRLKAHGFDPGGIDGDFGPKTLAAVKAFQKAKGLEVDGVVGPKTQAELKKAPQGAQAPQPKPAPAPTPTPAPATPAPPAPAPPPPPAPPAPPPPAPPAPELPALPPASQWPSFPAPGSNQPIPSILVPVGYQNWPPAVQQQLAAIQAQVNAIWTQFYATYYRRWS